MFQHIDMPKSVKTLISNNSYQIDRETQILMKNLIKKHKNLKTLNLLQKMHIFTSITIAARNIQEITYMKYT